MRDAGEKHADRRCIGGRGQKACERQRQNDEDIEENGCAGGRREASVRIEDGAQDRDHHDRGEERESDPRQGHRQVRDSRIALETGSDERKELSREDLGDQQYADLDEDHHRENAAGKGQGLVLAFLRQRLAIGRQERGVERAFREDRAEMIGQSERDEEGVRQGTGAEDGGDREIAQGACRPAQHGETGDCAEAADES